MYRMVDPTGVTIRAQRLRPTEPELNASRAIIVSVHALSRSRGYSLERGGAAGGTEDGFRAVLTTGERSKKPEALSSKPAYSVGITGQSSSRGTCVTPNVYLWGQNWDLLSNAIANRAHCFHLSGRRVSRSLK
jgi:hypothetical protein